MACTKAVVRSETDADADGSVKGNQKPVKQWLIEMA